MYFHVSFCENLLRKQVATVEKIVKVIKSWSSHYCAKHIDNYAQPEYHLDQLSASNDSKCSHWQPYRLVTIYKKYKSYLLTLIMFYFAAFLCKVFFQEFLTTRKALAKKLEYTPNNRSCIIVNDQDTLTPSWMSSIVTLWIYNFKTMRYGKFCKSGKYGWRRTKERTE